MPKSTWIDSCTCLCRESKQVSPLFLLAAAWLVIAGANAKYKGVGTINGGGNYGFMLTAKDSSPDTFRIKIWDKDAGDGVVYDNKMGESDDSYDGTELGGGNIKVHKAK